MIAAATSCRGTSGLISPGLGSRGKKNTMTAQAARAATAAGSVFPSTSS